MFKSRRPLRHKIREAATVVRSAIDRDRPMLVHIVPMRRCNLSCAYCNEYDSTSDPVPLDTMLARIDALAELGTAVVTISGGEPMLHPDLPKIIRHIHDRGMVSTLISNGYFMMPDRIKELNEARLDRLQISIDNVRPDDISKKSLKVLDRKLRYLSEFAEFDININSVLGAGVDQATDALVIAKRAIELGFTATMGVIHDEAGHLMALTPEEQRVYDEFKGLDPFSLTRFNELFQKNLADGQANDWKCRAGARYLYICEEGLVHYCSQQRGYPGVPLETYTQAKIAKEFDRPKACAPFCTIACVHQASAIDRFRSQTGTPFVEPTPESMDPARLPVVR